MEIDNEKKGPQSFKESEEWERFSILRELTTGEFRQYMKLKQRLNYLEEQKGKKIMDIFVKALGIVYPKTGEKSNVDKN